MEMKASTIAARLRAAIAEQEEEVSVQDVIAALEMVERELVQIALQTVNAPSTVQRKIRPDGTVPALPSAGFQEWIAAQSGCTFRIVGQESGKNSIFQTVLGSLQYIGDILNAKHKARIVIDYDPDAVNWVMTLFTDLDAPIPTDIR